MTRIQLKKLIKEMLFETFLDLDQTGVMGAVNVDEDGMPHPIKKKIAVAFTSPEALRVFRTEWKRYVGGTFSPIIINGERSGFCLNGPFEINAAREIESLHPGTLIGLPKETS